MVMLESPLLFCWLLFHYFFLNYLESKKQVYTVLVAVSLGTALAFKLPTIVFYPFIFFMIIIKNYLDKSKILKLREVIDMAIMYLLSIVIFAGFYVTAYISHGISGINAIINQVLHKLGYFCD